MSSGGSIAVNWRSVWREPGLRLLSVAVLVAVAALSSVAFFADRVERALALQGAALMAADLVVEQGGSIPDAWREHAESLGLQHARTVTFPSVVLANERPLLVQVKAVEAPYPMRGRLQVDTPAGPVARMPDDGQAWLENRLRDKLDIAIGADSLQLGELELDAAGVLVNEPDRGGNLFQLAPRLMITYEDAERSKLLGAGSRVRNRLLLAGDPGAVAEMRTWLSQRLPPGSELADVENARPELRVALERARRFLSLAALCASLLAGVAMLLASRRYVDRALDGAAVLRTLGMRARAVLAWHLKQLLVVVFVATLLGTLVGVIGQQALVVLVGDWFGETLPLPGWRPAGVALAFGMCLAIGFALPTLMRVGRVPPLRVLRRELDAQGLSGWAVWSLAILAFVGLMAWQVRDNELAIAMTLALLGTLAVLMLSGRLLLALLKPLRRTGGTAAMGLAALARYPQLTLLQLGGFGLGITLLLLLAVVRVDIIDTWRASLPEQAPNHFMLNLQPEERESFEQLVGDRAVPNSGLYATTRARLVAINGDDVQPEAYTDRRARRFAVREYSLGFSPDLQADNRILAGEWWVDPQSEPGFSLEEGIAETLGLEVGDTLAFDIAGQRIEAPVTSLRSVAWDSFNVNFFVVGSPALLPGLPVTYLTSLYLDDNSAAFTVELAKRFPAVSVLDLRPILRQVREIMDRGSLAVEMVFIFTLFAAALVTVAAAEVSRDERAREVAVMRTLGVSRRHLMRAVLTEFGVLGLIGGLLASALAALGGFLIASRLFDLPGSVGPGVWLLGIGGGTLVVALVGWLATRRLIDIPPLRVLNAG